MITGLTRNYKDSEQEVGVVIGKKDILFGTSVLMVNDRTLFISDTAINNNPSSTELVQIAKIIANNAKENNIKPRVAFIASDNFNKSENDVLEKVNKAIEILDKENVEFEYEGPISAEVALNEKLRNNNYPFSRLTDDANILIMPNLDSAKIAYHLLKETSKAVSIGPILSGFEYPVQILPIGSSVKQIINITAITCYNKICCDF